jgi:regulator of RNase E activity RraA
MALTQEQLDGLRAWPSPAIANAIETFNVRERTAGFMGPEIVCRFPEMKPIVGYAVTCKIRATIPANQEPYTVRQDAWWDHIASVPAPRIVVVQDLDQPPVGSLWGEVNANVHKAFGAVGVVTDGGVRDMDEVRELGFQFLAKEILVSHAYVHIVEVGIPVTVGGLVVQPGDLLHADQHGCINIPHDIADKVAAAAQRVEDAERIIINYCKRADFTRAGLTEAFAAMRQPPKK